MIKRSILALSLVGLWSVAFSQESDGQINPNSLQRIPKYEQLYKVKVWRVVDLKEKQNKGFFAKGNEITKLIIDAVASGELADVYENDSLTSKMDKQKFNDNMVAQQANPNILPWDPAKDFYQGDQVSFKGRNYEAQVDSKGKAPDVSTSEWTVTTAGQAVRFLPSEIYRMTLVEDVIFDKRRSRLYYDILSVELFAFDLNTNVYRPLGTFKYRDLEKLFRNHPDDAVWFNRQNTAENKNYADAFLLRLFHGVIEKVENPDDDKIEDIYTANTRPYRESVWAREWEEMKLMEREHNLWEY